MKFNHTPTKPSLPSTYPPASFANWNRRQRWAEKTKESSPCQDLAPLPTPQIETVSRGHRLASTCLVSPGAETASSPPARPGVASSRPKKENAGRRATTTMAGVIAVRSEGWQFGSGQELTQVLVWSLMWEAPERTTEGTLSQKAFEARVEMPGKGRNRHHRGGDKVRCADRCRMISSYVLGGRVGKTEISRSLRKPSFQSRLRRSQHRV